MENKAQQLQLDKIKEAIYEQAQEDVDMFVDKQCIRHKGLFVTKKEFKKELNRSYGWVSQYTIGQYMRARGFGEGRIYLRGKQCHCWLGIKIGIKK